MSIVWWRYPARSFRLGSENYVVRTSSRGASLFSELLHRGAILATDSTPLIGPGSTRNHRLEAEGTDGGPFTVEAGYVGLGWVTGIVVRREGELAWESHPGKTVGYPDDIRDMAEARDVGAFAPRNRVPLLVDLATGLLFFVVAKLTDLTTAALVGAAVGIALVLFQRLTRIDVTGGLALFGIVMLLISAGIAWFADDPVWVQLRGTVVGLIAAGLFLGDAMLFRGRLLAGALARYMPYGDLDPRRLGIGMGASGAAMALLNLAVTRGASQDFWLVYSTFIDIPVTMVLLVGVLQWARGGTKPG